MSQFLLYGTVDAQVKDEMGSQSPSADKRARAVEAEVRNLSTKYDIDSFIRPVDISVVTDGSVEYKIEDLVVSDDVRKVKSIRYVTNDKIITQLENVEFDNFMNDLDRGAHKNQFTTYYSNGFLYLRVMTSNFSSSVESMTLRYLTSNLSIDSVGNFISTVTSDPTLYILVPDKYLDLISLGAQKRLFYQSIGESDQAQLGLIRNRYDSELKKLGLSSDAKNIERKVNKVKIHKQW